MPVYLVSIHMPGYYAANGAALFLYLRTLRVFTKLCWMHAMPCFKIQAGKTPFKNPWGGETSWVEMEAEDLASVLIKCKLKYPETPILNVFAKRWTVADGSRKGKVIGGELLFSTFEEMPE